jgi:hypothetical protein
MKVFMGKLHPVKTYGGIRGKCSSVTNFVDSPAPHPVHFNVLWKSTMMPTEWGGWEPPSRLDAGVKLRVRVPAGNLTRLVQTIACYVNWCAMLVQFYLSEDRSERLYGILGAYSYATENLTWNSFSRLCMTSTAGILYSASSCSVANTFPV